MSGIIDNHVSTPGFHHLARPFDPADGVPNWLARDAVCGQNPALYFNYFI